MRTLFVVCQHGDEKTPLEVIKQYFQRVPFLLANPKAYEKGTRYIETDLNRSFPGNSSGTMEERLAEKVLKKINGESFDCVIDLHTASCSTPAFTILTKDTPMCISLAQSAGVNKVVYMSGDLASGKALIDHIPLGISIEFGQEGTKETAKRIYSFFMHYLESKKSLHKLEFYKVFAVLKKESGTEKLVAKVKSFSLVKKGDPLITKNKNIIYSSEDFYPILARSKNYKNLHCLMAKKVAKNRLEG